MSRQIPPAERISVKYADYVAKGILLTERDGEIEIKTPDGTVTEALRREVDRLKVELIAHLRTLPQREETMNKTITEAQSKALDIMLPSPRFAKWIQDTLVAQEVRTSRKAPQTYHETLHTWERIRANEPPTEIAILTAEDWERFIELVF